MIPDAGYEMQDTRCGIRDAGYEMQDANQIGITNYRLSNIAYR